MEKKLSLIKEIPAGYKQTEIGVIPEDWDVHEIEDVADVLSGKRIPKGRTLTENITPYPYISVSDMEARSVNLENIRFVPEDVYPLIKKYRIFVDDIYISVAGTLGLIGTIPKEINGANLTENADRLTNIKCDKDYLLYILSSPLIQKTIDETKTLGAQPKLALTRIRKFCIAIPQTKFEQTAISTVLSDTDALIEHLEKLIAKKKAIKQGAMQQLLTGKKRLPGFNGEWKVKKLGEIAEIKKGQLITDRTRINGSIPVIAGGKALAYYHNKANRRGKTITVSGSGANSGYVTFHTKPIFASDCSTIEESKNYSIEFIYFLLQSLQEKIYKMQTGGAQPHIHPSDLNPIIVVVPKLEEQTAIANILSDMETEIESLEHKRDKYTMLKQGMMQQLLTGRIRIYANN